MIEATLELDQAARRRWEVVVVGAGPAGALAARELARKGLAVLLVDKAAFPRHKVCGCCLNLATLATLEKVGLGRLPVQSSAEPLRFVLIAAQGRRAILSLPGGVALSREAFDVDLVRAAIRAGADFLPRTRATPGAVAACQLSVRLAQGEHHAELLTRLVLAADGLGGNFLRAERVTQQGSRVGAGAIVENAPTFYEPGTIYLAYANVGYVGLVRLEDGRLDLAAALDPATLKHPGQPSAAAESIMADAGLPPIPGLDQLDWRGTPHLTRRPLRVSAHRLFALGDAAGYVEPFTGEGIAWAMASAVAVVPVALKAVRQWNELLAEEWEVVYHGTIAQRQRLCRAVTGVLRHPIISRGIIGLLSRMPALASPVLRSLNASPDFGGCRR